MTTGTLMSHRTGRFFLIPLALTLTACGHQTPQVTSPPSVVAAPVPSIAGSWTGTQNQMFDVNKTPFQFTAQFGTDGTFSLTGNWQGMNGPAGQNMAGTYTQSGTQISFSITRNEALAAGQTVSMSGYSGTGTVTPDGKSLDLGKGIAEYVLKRN
jgi:predicted small lipoprotein YifL